MDIWSLHLCMGGSVVSIDESAFSPEVATDLVNLLETLPVLLDTALQALQSFHF